MIAPDTTEIETTLRAHMESVLMARVSSDESRRAEALRDYLRVTNAAVSASQAETLADMIPPLLPSLYRRWIHMFLARLFETVPQEQIALLCDGSKEGSAALVLSFLMFLESARMEKQMAADLQAFGASQTGLGDNPQAADAAATFLRNRVAELARREKKDN